jgi:hypothetical protein
MKTKRYLLVFGIAVIALLLTVSSVSAGNGYWSGTVGGISVTASNNVYLNAYTWSTDLVSSSTSSCNVIGYTTYWTTGEFCPSTGTWASKIQYNGAYATNNTWYYKGTSFYYVGCSGTSYLEGFGNHDFGCGTGHIYPYVVGYQTR